MQEDKMHGSIFVFLKRFVENQFDYSTWLKLLDKAAVGHTVYKLDEMYPTKEIYAIVKAASDLVGISEFELQEKFGEFLAPDLLLIYKKYIKPEWRTYEMLLNTEVAMHGAVRKEDGRTDPPILLVTKKGNKQLIVDYHSKRKMSSLAVGIIKGIARYYNEADLVKVTPLTLPHDERVQIKVDFI